MSSVFSSLSSVDTRDERTACDSPGSSGEVLSDPPQAMARQTRIELEAVQDIGVRRLERLRQRRELPPAHHAHHACPHLVRLERALHDLDVARRAVRLDGEADRHMPLLALLHLAGLEALDVAALDDADLGRELLVDLLVLLLRDDRRVDLLRFVLVAARALRAGRRLDGVLTAARARPA